MVADPIFYSMHKLFIIVPLYNGREDIPDFCASLKQTTNKDSYALIAVDDCSSDESVHLLRQQIPSAVVLRTDRNSGYAGACNRGMDYAIQQGAGYVMLANQDLRFLDGWLDPLMESLEHDSMIAAVQPKILMYPDTTLINSC